MVFLFCPFPLCYLCDGLDICKEQKLEPADGLLVWFSCFWFERGEKISSLTGVSLTLRAASE